MSDAPGVEAVARWLCRNAEYHEQNWRLYCVRAQQLIDIYLHAIGYSVSPAKAVA